MGDIGGELALLMERSCADAGATSCNGVRKRGIFFNRKQNHYAYLKKLKMKNKRKENIVELEKSRYL